MLLSVVMIVKNEEKYLDKTLHALKDLRRDIDSELIILDTGSTDNTVEIAKKYTDKVYFAKWNEEEVSIGRRNRVVCFRRRRLYGSSR